MLHITVSEILTTRKLKTTIHHFKEHTIQIEKHIKTLFEIFVVFEIFSIKKCKNQGVKSIQYYCFCANLVEIENIFCVIFNSHASVPLSGTIFLDCQLGSAAFSQGVNSGRQ